MKKNYVAPVAEKINFEYKDQVVATSGNRCKYQTGFDSYEYGKCDDADTKPLYENN